MNLKRTANSPAHFENIRIGEITVSIQASGMHYCSPRETMASSDDYQEFEVALMKSEDWFHPDRDNRFNKCSWASYWSEYDDVAGYVPRAEVIKMLSDLKTALCN